MCLGGKNPNRNRRLPSSLTAPRGVIRCGSCSWGNSYKHPLRQRRWPGPTPGSCSCRLAQSAGKTAVTDQNTPGGYTLTQHSQDSTSLAKIALGTFHYVVLQEQSQIPTIEYWRYNAMYPTARFLDSLIHSAGESTAFYMTWGRKYGGTQSLGWLFQPAVCRLLRDAGFAALVLLDDCAGAVGDSGPGRIGLATGPVAGLAGRPLAERQQPSLRSRVLT